jgi:hypothetical protein
MWELFRDLGSVPSAAQEPSTVYSLCFADEPIYLVRLKEESSTESVLISSAPKKAIGTQRLRSRRKSGK